MLPTKLYYKLLSLEHSNRNLLKIYYNLYEKTSRNNETELKEILNNRIELREKIAVELKDCIEKLEAENSGSFTDRSSIFFLPGIVEFEYGVYDVSRNYNFNQCHECELSNVTQYYETLYSPGAEHELVNLLLQQKDKIEEYLIREM